jgi:hypothetical protein
LVRSGLAGITLSQTERHCVQIRTGRPNNGHTTRHMFNSSPVSPFPAILSEAQLEPDLPMPGHARCA